MRAASIAAETRPAFGTYLEPPSARPVLHAVAAGERYIVERALARGGMGEVFLGRDCLLGRRVVLKLPRGDFEDARNQACQSSVVREGQLLSLLDHRFVVGIHDVLHHSGRRGLVLQHVDGVPLDEVNGLGAAEVAVLGRRIALALAHIHDRDIVHLDLKLENVLLRRDGTPCVIDFGIAQAPGRVHKLPGAGGIIGTPRIMAPELLGGGEASGRSDLFSLGVLLSELLGPAPLPPALAALLDELVEPDPSRRPPGARVVAGRLAQVRP